MHLNIFIATGLEKNRIKMFIFLSQYVPHLASIETHLGIHWDTENIYKTFCLYA